MENDRGYCPFSFSSDHGWTDCQTNKCELWNHPTEQCGFSAIWNSVRAIHNYLMEEREKRKTGQ